MNRAQLLSRLRTTSRRDLLTVGLPALLIVLGAFWLAAQFVQPAPPGHMVIATGGAGGGYQRYAAEYRQVFARENIDLREKPTSGALENLELLRKEGSGVDAAFIQGGTVDIQEDDSLYALGAVYHEPVWVFYRKDLGDLTRISQLRGRHVAIGPEGSGTRRLASDLLRANGMGIAQLQFSDQGGLAAAKAIHQGRLDAVFLVGPVQSAAVWTLLYDPSVAVMNLVNAEAYVRMFPHLTHLLLPQGAIDLVRGIPAQDLNLVAPMAQIVVREDTHPALVDLLLQSMSEVHARHGVFQKAGEFPKAQGVDLPLSPRADRYYKTGKPLLQRYLPFWLANLIDRLVVFVIPLLAVVVPVVKFAPALYGWRVRSRIFKRYGELKFLEAEVEARGEEKSTEDWMARLAAIEKDVNHIPTPLAYSDMLYNLRSHIDLVRAAIQRQQDRP